MNLKNVISISLVVTFFIVISSLNGFAYIKLNGVGGGYGDDGAGTASTQASADGSIEYYVMTGGAYFLDANSHIQSLLAMVERQDFHGVNYADLLAAADNALLFLHKAADSYSRLIDLADHSPYNSLVLEKLRVFDYDAFAKQFGLSSDSVSPVRRFLHNGDITGMLKKAHNEYMVMIDLLTRIKTALYQFRLPDLSLCWQLNEAQAASSLFGSIVARIFAAIRN